MALLGFVIAPISSLFWSIRWILCLSSAKGELVTLLLTSHRKFVSQFLQLWVLSGLDHHHKCGSVCRWMFDSCALYSQHCLLNLSMDSESAGFGLIDLLIICCLWSVVLLSTESSG